MTTVFHIILFATFFLINSSVAQTQILVQPAVDSREFTDLAVFSDDYGHPGPVIGISGTARQHNAPVSYSASGHHLERAAYSAKSHPNTNTPESINLDPRCDSAKKISLRSSVDGCGAPATSRDHAADGFSAQNTALAALYDATSGDSWNNNTNWDPMANPTTEELGTWHGVTVHLGRLTELHLDDNNLRGTLPPEVGDLTDLQVLWIDGNSLDGSIPKELGQLSQLRTLLISHNELSGSITDQLDSLEVLETLWLHYNGISGMIPTTLGNLTKLRSLVLSGNMLSGGIPDELGSLDSLEALWLNDNDLSGEVPQAIGELENLQQLVLDNNDLSGSLPQSLLDLQKLKYLSFEGQSLCAPSDGAFQAWLRSIEVVKGAVCNENIHLTGSIDNLSFEINQAISPVAFPVAKGGRPPYTYALDPTPPGGLMFDPASRLLAGTPSVISVPIGYTYTASDYAGAQASQMFSIEVVGLVLDAEDPTLPESFTLQGNYPNPFHEVTQIVLDLPMPAVVTIDVMDLIGRHVLAVAATNMPAGRRQSILLNGSSLTSGLYLYRVQFSSQEYTKVLFGRLLHIQ